MSVLPVGIGSEVGAGGYQIERSLRFNSADTAHLTRTGGTSTNRKIHTFSLWTKYLVTGGTKIIASAGSDSNNREWLGFDSNSFYYQVKDSANFYDLGTTQVLRDPSAWYHLVVAIDTTQATSSNRVKMYINGVQVTAFSSATYPLQNDDLFFNDSNGGTSYIGALTGSVSSTFAYPGYLTEFYFIDGQALSATDFGEFNSDTGVWQPIEYTGTYGTNGFYLPFSDNTSTTTLGYDDSGNNNDWTLNNFSVTAGAGNDSLVDSPTRYGTDTGAGGEVRGNYATLNAVKPVTNSIAFSNGNLQYKPGSSWSTTTYVEGTIGVVGGSTGKYYWEMSADQVGGLWTAGVALQNNTIGGSNIGTTGSVMIYDNAKYVNGTSTSSYLTSLSANEVLGIALDAATGKVWFRDSGGWLGSGDPAAGTNETGIPTGFSGAVLVPVTQANSASTVTANFGQRPFAYTAPSGFKALVTTNLPEPTIADGGEYFNTVLWTGTGSGQSITGMGFQPDWLWFKHRNGTSDHALMDAVRGATKGLRSNSTNAEVTSSAGQDLVSFDSDGFTTGTPTNFGSLGGSGATIVTWGWKANGAGVSNTDGTITSTVSANTDAGFSIVTFNIPSSGTSDTVGHGLGVAPSMVILKSRATSSWGVYHSGLISAAYYLRLQTTNAQALGNNYWNSTAPTSSVFTIGSTWYGTTNAVAYCFAPVAGYSAFGSYTGNGSADGPFVYTGFRPAFVMQKSSSLSGTGWHILDVERSPSNPNFLDISANASSAEYSGSGYRNIDFLSNGFKIRVSAADLNQSSGTYIYMAFAENPFKYSLAR